MRQVELYITHSHRAANIATRYGWLPGARYTNLRDIKRFERIGFIDIHWKKYNFKDHLNAVKKFKPKATVANDIEDISQLDTIIAQATELSEYVERVIIVPKAPELEGQMKRLIPKQFVLGYSVPTKYGGSTLSLQSFDREVHLLGGRPDVQRKLANHMNVVSVDCNRFTIDAAYGDYFDGKGFKRHPIGGYERCLEESIANISMIWRI